MTDRVAVLVVDEILVRLDVADQLRDAGYEVFEPSNADEAMEILNVTSSIRLMFTDKGKPGTMDGLKLAAAVRDRWPPVKTIVTSGHRIVTLLKCRMAACFSASPTLIWLSSSQCMSCCLTDRQLSRFFTQLRGTHMMLPKATTIAVSDGEKLNLFRKQLDERKRHIPAPDAALAGAFV